MTDKVKKQHTFATDGSASAVEAAKKLASMPEAAAVAGTMAAHLLEELLDTHDTATLLLAAKILVEEERLWKLEAPEVHVYLESHMSEAAEIGQAHYHEHVAAYEAMGAAVELPTSRILTLSEGSKLKN